MDLEKIISDMDICCARLQAGVRCAGYTWAGQNPPNDWNLSSLARRQINTRCGVRRGDTHPCLVELSTILHKVSQCPENTATGAFSWLKMPISTSTIKKLLRQNHLNGCLNTVSTHVKLGRWRKKWSKIFEATCCFRSLWFFFVKVLVGALVGPFPKTVKTVKTSRRLVSCFTALLGL